MTPAQAPGRYTTTAIGLHWLVAAVVIGLIALGWWMQEIPKQPVGPRADAYNLHKSIGVAVLFLMVARLAWRSVHRAPGLPPLPLWQERAARAIHLILYAGMFIVAFSGYLGSATSGYPVKFFGWVLPDWAGANVSVKEACSAVHLAVSWVLTAAIGIHFLATAYHHWVLRDGLLWRMWPGRAPAAGRNPSSGAASPAPRPPAA
jgi:cytochrome b561